MYDILRVRESHWVQAYVGLHSNCYIQMRVLKNSEPYMELISKIVDNKFDIQAFETFYQDMRQKIEDGSYKFCAIRGTIDFILPIIIGMDLIDKNGYDEIKAAIFKYIEWVAEKESLNYPRPGYHNLHIWNTVCDFMRQNAQAILDTSTNDEEQIIAFLKLLRERITPNLILKEQ